jgi:hypothetical protein
MSDVDTNPDYWDCECDAYYIHRKAQTACALCEARADEQPDSRAGEVERAKHPPDEWVVEPGTADECLEQAMRALYATLYAMSLRDEKH